jgi:hypothetical protein
MRKNRNLVRQRSCNVITIPQSKQTTSSMLAVSMLIASRNADSKKTEIKDYPELQQIIELLKLTPEEYDNAEKLLTATIGNINTFIINAETMPIAFDVIQSVFFLTMDGFYDPKLQRDIILTITTYTTAKQYLATLLVRYFDDDSIACKNRVMTIISFWAKLNPQVFDEDMISSLLSFSGFVSSDRLLGDSVQFKLFVNSIKFLRKCKDQETKFTSVGNSSVEPQTFFTAVRRYGTQFMAEQFVMLHSRIFTSISQEDFVHIIFMNEKPKSLDNYTQMYDNLSIFVSYSIIYNPKTEDRVNAFKIWVEIAIELKKCNDYFGLFGVMLGLQHKSVTRMTKTIDLAMHECRGIKEEFDKLVVLTSVGSNFKEYRDAILVSPSPSVPFLACFQKDWVYFRESYPARNDGLINLVRVRKGIELLEKIIYMRSDNYNIEANEVIITMISNLAVDADTQKLMNISRKNEAD